MRDWRTDDPEMELLAPEPGAICPMPMDSTANKMATERLAYGSFCCDYERIANELGQDTSSVWLREQWAILPAERKAAYLRKAASSVSRQAQMTDRAPGVPATLRSALKQAQLELVPQTGIWLQQDAVSEIDTNEFYSRINAATSRIHAALEADHWVYLHGQHEEDGDDSNGEAWARACVAAYLIRYRDQQPAEALRRAFEGLTSSKARAGLENKLRLYAPILFSVALFKLGATTTDGEDSNRWFSYYASSAVGFIRNKLKTFPGCDFIFHINEEVGDEVGLLHSMYKEAHGRIAFHEYRFTPRKRIAPWLIAAMRLAPLLDCRWRLVVSADIHDQRDLQNSQLVEMIAKLRRKRKEMLITYWIAEESNDECMVSSALPVGKGLAQVLSKSGASVGIKASELHTHTDAGLLVFRGARCRDVISQSHDGLSFISHLSNLVRGAKTIPHGVEEMAFDLYLFEADWAQLQPFVHFDLHVNVMMGAEDGNIRANWVDDSISIGTKVRYDVVVHQIDIDVGVADWEVQLPCCRHSRVFDCEDHAKKIVPKTSAKLAHSATAACAAVSEPAKPIRKSTRHESGFYARAMWTFYPPISVTDRVLLPLKVGESMYVERGKDDAWALVLKPNGLRGFVPTTHIKVFSPDSRSPDSAKAVAAFQDLVPAMKPARAGWRVCWSTEYMEWYYWPVGGGASQWEDPGGPAPVLTSDESDETSDTTDSSESDAEDISTADATGTESQRQLYETQAVAQRARAKQALAFFARKVGSTGTWHKFRSTHHAYGQLPVSQFSLEEAAECIKECCQGKRASFGGYVFCKDEPLRQAAPASAKAVDFQSRSNEERRSAESPIFAMKVGAVGARWYCFKNIGAAKGVLPISEYSDRECRDAIDECCVGKRESFGGYYFSKDRATGNGRRVPVIRIPTKQNQPERWGSSFEDLKIAAATKNYQENDSDDDSSDDEAQPSQRRLISRKRFEPARWFDDPHASANLGGDKVKYRELLVHRQPRQASNPTRGTEGLTTRLANRKRKRKEWPNNCNTKKPHTDKTKGRVDLWCDEEDRNLRECVCELVCSGQVSVAGPDWHEMAMRKRLWTTKRNGPALRHRWYHLCALHGAETNSKVSAEHVLLRTLRTAPREREKRPYNISAAEIKKLLGDAPLGAAAGTAAAASSPTDIDSLGPCPGVAVLARKATSRSGRVVKQHTRAPGFVDATDKSLKFASPKGGFSYSGSLYAGTGAEPESIIPQAVGKLATSAANAAVIAAQTAAAQATAAEPREGQTPH